MLAGKITKVFIYAMNSKIERRESPIHGIGTFALEDIPRKTKICIGHHCCATKDYFRTKDVAFFNYSEKPNAITPYKYVRYKNGLGMITEVKALHNIKKGEEITLKYSWYDPTKPDTKDNKHYRPLPDNVYLKGDRLYASKDIDIFNEFGTTHNFVKYLDKYVANALGGFLTKDKESNCKLIKSQGKKTLISIKSIKKDTLLTINNYE